MSVISRTSLKKFIEQGDIVVHPYDPSHVGNCSIDIRLGKWFFRQRRSANIVDLHSSNVWKTYPEYTDEIILEPGEMILATSEEFIGSRLKCTTMAKTKSTTLRHGLDCFGSSGWGDIGYINRWSFSLRNRTNHTVKLKAGTWIAQIVFLSVSDEETSYTSGGHYQSTDDFEQLVETWDPKSILPKPLSWTSIDNF